MRVGSKVIANDSIKIYKKIKNKKNGNNKMKNDKKKRCFGNKRMIQMMGKVELFLFLLEFNLGLIHAKDVKAEDKFMVQNGSTVTIHYTLTVDHKVVDSSIGKKPLIYVQGMGQIIPGMEEQLKDLKQGDKKHIKIGRASC